MKKKTPKDPRLHDYRAPSDSPERRIRLSVDVEKEMFDRLNRLLPAGIRGHVLRAVIADVLRCLEENDSRTRELIGGFVAGTITSFVDFAILDE